MSCPNFSEIVLSCHTCACVCAYCLGGNKLSAMLIHQIYRLFLTRWILDVKYNLFNFILVLLCKDPVFLGITLLCLLIEFTYIKRAFRVTADSQQIHSWFDTYTLQVEYHFCHCLWENSVLVCCMTKTICYFSSSS